MNPFYNRPGLTRVEAFKLLIRQCYRWGRPESWHVYLDTIDGDYHVFGRNLAEGRYKKIARGSFVPSEFRWMPNVKIILL